MQGRDTIQTRFANQRLSPPVSDAAPHGAVDALAWNYQRLALGSDVLAIAAETEGNGVLGIVSGIERHTGREPFLLLSATVADDDAYGAGVQRRLLAALLLRQAGMEELPAALAVPSHLAGLQEAMRAFAALHGGVRFYPPAAENVVPMLTGAMALRIGRATGLPIRTGAPAGGFGAGLVVLDLRGADEESIIAAARKMYRARLPRRRPVTASPRVPHGRRARG